MIDQGICSRQEFDVMLIKTLSSISTTTYKCQDAPCFNTASFVFAPGMIALDQDGHVAAGTSTNGLTHKVPGYVDFEMAKKKRKCLSF